MTKHAKHIRHVRRARRLRQEIRAMDAQYDDLLRRIHDPDYSLEETNYRIVEEVKYFLARCRAMGIKTFEPMTPLVCDLLLRVRNSSAAVFAITVASFPGYENLEERWKSDGYVDITGCTWLAPRA